MVGMRPYSEDLRTRIIAVVEDGMPNTEAARLFGVSRSSVSRSSLKRYCTLAANEEPLAPRKGGGRPPKTNTAIERLLEEDVSRRDLRVYRGLLQHEREALRARLSEPNRVRGG